MSVLASQKEPFRLMNQEDVLGLIIASWEHLDILYTRPSHSWYVRSFGFRRKGAEEQVRRQSEIKLAKEKKHVTREYTKDASIMG